MNSLLTLFDVNTTFFTIFNYPMSYIEFFGTLANLVCVYLIAKKNVLSWPIGIIGVLLFGALFYQINLYADLFEQSYYLVTGFWGWYVWQKYKSSKKEDENDNDIVVERNTKKQNVTILGIILVSTILVSYVMSNIHIWLPRLFPEPASLVLLDTFTTMLSFAAQFLLIKKRLENWVLWIVVDIIGIWLYWYKGVPFVALLYFIFLIIASNGLITWTKSYREQKEE